MKKNLHFFILLFLIIFPAATQAMPPHPKLIENWKEQGILKEKINDYHQRQSALKSIVLKSGSFPQKSFSSTGTHKVCVLLIQYSNAEMDSGSTDDFYSDLFNGGGSTTLTLKKYFQDMSNSALTFEFDIYGPYTASKTHDYYGTDNAETDFPSAFKNIKIPHFLFISVAALFITCMLFSFPLKKKKIWSSVILILLIPVFSFYIHGCNNSGTGDSNTLTGTPVDGNDAHAAELVIEAVNAADPYVDFSEYDNDGDGYVDSIIVIHQGTGQEAIIGNSTDIWSHNWNLASAKYYGDGTGVVTTGDSNVKVKVYTIQPEYTFTAGDSSIGVFAHEMGHVLGLPDLYDVDYETWGVGDWSLMASGSWCGPGSDGSRPAPLLAWERNKIGGSNWITVTEITTDQTNVLINNIESDHSVYKITLSSASGQYILLEGKKQSTSDEWTVNGSGILVTHIHEGIINSYTSSNQVNTGYTRVHGINIVEADGHNNLWEMNNLGESSDLFNTSKNQLTGTTTPNTKYYTSEATSSKTGMSGVSITEIYSGTSPMTFNVDL